MGLLSIIRKNRQKEREMRILFLGLDNAGKTTILKKLNNEDISGISPTLGFNIKTFVHRAYTLNIWDVGGQTTLRPYWRNYFEQTDALVWVVDSSDRMRMHDCKRELHSLLTEDRLAGASLLVFANKQDLPGSMDDSEISNVSLLVAAGIPFSSPVTGILVKYSMLINTQQALDLPSIKSHHWTIWPCSAVTGQNLVSGLDWVVNDVANRLYYSSTTAHPTNENIGGAPQPVEPIS
ncbi:ADP-ribosylation factor-like protein 2 [Coprinopsis cinerea okayama7|uniref:ADP-ribosylation factor-like protein 2 n=1 Tax=Coprinopsis cinerea (strain Okayama-7 / 130 / ATCC MYA-4618 / FGSC 9003) TaxID=240176 RepID=D6RMP3_COPC7|nr:ADP-ribosylation factor-like protein 2 [Coprinopsis cinerea okayama7\|eukprot:XP_002911139.1 ADP-ribosylation factor-like protein 2 [Coprinopsis cinerea okayama7\